MLLDLLETFQQADTGPATTHGIRVTSSQGIDLAKLKRVYAELLAEVLNRRFQGEVGLRAGRRTIGTRAGLVGLSHVGTDIEVWAAIDAGKMKATKAS